MKKNYFLFLFLIIGYSIVSATEVYLTTYGGSYPTEKWVDITTGENGTGDVIWAQGDGTYGNSPGLLTNEPISIVEGVTYYINCYDKYDDSWDGTLYVLKDAYGNIICNNNGNSPDDGNDQDSSYNFEDRDLERESSEAFSYITVANPAPTNLFADNITEGSAELNWTENGTAELWNIEYGIEGFTQGEGTYILNIDTNPYSLIGLEDGTTYEFYVQSVYTNDASEWSNAGSFTTELAPITEFPYNESFEDDWIGSPAAPLGWEVINNNEDNDMWVQYSGSTYAHTGSSCAKINTDFNSGQNDDYLISPAVNLTGNQRLKFWCKVRSSGEPNDLEVLLSTSDNNISSFTEVLLPLTSFSNTTYEEIVIDLSEYSTTSYIAFHIPPGGLDGWILYLDDITIEEIPNYDFSLSVNKTFDYNTPGHSIGYLVTIDNLGETDTYDIIINSELGWECISNVNSISVDSESSGVFYVEVSIPEDAEEDIEDNITVTVSSQSLQDLSKEITFIAQSHTKDIYEDNNTMENASPIDFDLSRTYVWSSDPTTEIYPDDDVDFYTFYGEQYQVINIEMISSDGLYGGVTLYDEEGAILLDDSDFSSSDRNLSYQLPYDGDYFILTGYYSDIPIASRNVSMEVEDREIKKALKGNNNNFTFNSLSRATTGKYTLNLELQESPEIILGEEEIETRIAFNSTLTEELNLYNEGEATLIYSARIYGEGLPDYEEDFETNLDNWTLVYGDDDPDTNPMLQHQDAANSGRYGFRFSSYNSSTDYNQWIYSESFSPLEDDKELTFKYKKSNAYSNELFKVGYSTINQAGPEDYIWTDEIAVTASGWNDYSMILPAETTSIAFHYYSNYKYYLYIDDIAIGGDPIPQWLTLDNEEGEILANGNGQIMVNLNSENLVPEIYHGTIKISSNGGDDEFIPVTIDVNNIPTIEDINLSTSEDTPIEISFVGEDLDEDELTFSIVDEPQNGNFENGIYSPNENWFGTETFTYKANDGLNDSEIKTVTINVTSVDDNIVVNELLPSETELTINETEIINFSIDATDPDGNDLEYSWKVNNQQVSTSSYYDFVSNYVGDYSAGQYVITLYVTDNYQDPSRLSLIKEKTLLRNSSAYTWNVTVNNVNQIPSVESHEFTTNEDEPISIEMVGEDLDEDELTFSIVTAPVNGVYEEGIYTPNADWFGTDTIEYRAFDGIDYSEIGVLTVNVTSVDDNIVVNELLPSETELTINETDTINFSIDATDPDGNDLEYSWKVNDQEVSTSSIYDFVSDYLGDYSAGEYVITLYVTDNYQDPSRLSLIKEKTLLRNSNEYTWNVTVNNVNRIPTVESHEFTTNEDEPISIEMVGNDLDNEDLTYEIVTAPVNGNYEEGIYTPNANWFGTDTIEYRAFDGIDYSEVGIFTIQVLQIEDSPFVQNAIEDFSFDEDTSYSSINLHNVFNDYDLEYGDELTFAYFGNENINVSLNDGIVTLIPNTNWFGNELITFTATDLAENTISEEVLVTINSVNDLPQLLLPETESFAEDTILQVDYSNFISDIETENPLLTVSGNEHVNVDINGYLVTYSAVENWNGEEIITFSLNDYENRAIVTDDVVVTVNYVNDAPFVENPIIDYQIDEDLTDSSINLNEVFNDPDLIYGDELTFTAEYPEMFNVIINENGVVDITPQENWVGTETFIFFATDSFGETVSDDVQIEVVPTNVAPNLDIPLELSFNEDEVHSEDYSEFISDEDDDISQLWLDAESSEHISVSVDGFVATFVSSQDWNGTEEITFNLYDRLSRSVTSKTVSVTVNYVNDAPFVENEIADFSFPEDTTDSSINLNDVFNDADLIYGDELSFEAISSDHINAIIDNDILVLEPLSDWIGSESITVLAMDSFDATVSEEFNVTITNVNDAPTINLPQTYSFDEDTISIWNVTSFINDIDPDSDLTLFAENSDHIFVEVNGMEISFSASENWNGTETIVFTISDNENRAIASDEVNVTVHYVNDAPFVENQITLHSIYEDQTDNTLVINDIFDDVDLIYGDELGAIAMSSEHISATILNGTIQLHPELNWVGQEDISVSVFDSANEMVNYTIPVEVLNVNDAPTIQLPPSLTMNEDEPFEIDIAPYINDIDGDELVVSAQNSTNIFVSLDGTIATLTSSENWYGAEAITFIVDDQNSPLRNQSKENNHIFRANASDQILVYVNPTNDAPHVITEFENIVQDEEFSEFSIELSSHFEDIDGDDLVFTASASEEIVGLEVIGDYLFISSIPQLYGVTNITVSAYDEVSRESVSTEFTFTINPVNDAPILSDIDDFAMFEDIPEIIMLEAMDYDNDDLTFSAEANITELQLFVGSNSLVITPIENWCGTGFITVFVNDGEYSDSKTFAVTVVPLNDAPVIVSEIQDFALMEDFDSFEVDLNDYIIDPDNDNLSFEIDYNEAVINLEITNSIVTISPLENVYGETEISVTANDGISRSSRLSVTTQFNVIIDAVNDAPIINSYLPQDDIISINEVTIVHFEISASDVDNDDLTYSWFVNDAIVNNAVENNWDFNIDEAGEFTVKVIVNDGELEDIHEWTVQSTVSVSNNEVLPVITKLEGNYPNPFNPITTIKFSVKEGESASLMVLNVKGQVVKDLGEYSPGDHSVTWAGKDNKNQEVSSGLFFYMLKSKSKTQVKKMMLLK